MEREREGGREREREGGTERDRDAIQHAHAVSLKEQFPFPVQNEITFPCSVVY